MFEKKNFRRKLIYSQFWRWGVSFRKFGYYTSFLLYWEISGRVVSLKVYAHKGTEKNENQIGAICLLAHLGTFFDKNDTFFKNK